MIRSFNFLLITLCSVFAAKGQSITVAEQIADAIVNPAQKLVELNSEDYSLLTNTLRDSSLTELQKNEILSADVEVWEYVKACTTSAQILISVNAQNYIQDATNLQQVLNYFHLKTGFEPIQNGGCDAYNGKAAACDAYYIGCIALGATVCSATTIGWFGCASLVWAGCTANLSGCHSENNGNYPECAKKAGRGLFWKNLENPWLIPTTSPYQQPGSQN